MFQRDKKYNVRIRAARINAACAHVVEALEDRLLLAAHIVGNSTVYPTIQAAVDAAAPGATITVDPGNYPEQVVVSEPLTIEGAQAGVDARLSARLNGTASTESIVTGATRSFGQSSAFYINANDVTIDGFTVEGETNQNDTYGAGIVIAAYQYGTHIINNVVQNNVSGLFLANDSTTDPALIQYNVFLKNNNAGENGGRGIYTDETLSGGSLTDVSIDSNLFSDNYGGEYTSNLEAAIALEASIPGAQSDISITNNEMTGNGKALLAFNATNIVFDGNTVTGCQDQYSGSIRFEGNVQNVTIDSNNVYANWGPAVAVDSKGAAGDNSGFVVNGNDFVGNNAAYNTPISLVYAANAYDGVLNAENNWWDSVSGPGGDGTGSGDAASAGIFQEGLGLGWALAPGGDTLYAPWSATSNKTSAIPPTAPTGLTAVATSGTQVALQWTDTAANIESGFVVQRSVDGTTFTPVGTTATGVTIYTDETAVAGTAYTYRVYATSPAGSSDYSAIATVTTPLVATAPTGLVATATSATNVHLSWTDTAPGIETGFFIDRSLNGTTFTQVGTTSAGQTSFTDQTAIGDTAFTYLVYASSLGGNSPDSLVASVTTPYGTTAPTGLVATAKSATDVNLSWTDTAPGVETGFVIERSLNGTTFTPDGTTNAGVTSYIDQTAVGGTAYTYLVYATSLAGISPNSAVTTVTTPLVATAPTSLEATATSATDVNLSWTDTAVGVETGFVIDRSLNGTDFTQIGTANTGVTNFTDQTAVAGTKYTYLVYATSLGGNSPNSIVATVTTPLVATAPTALVATATSATNVNLSWTDTAVGIETGFVVERSINGTTFTQIGTTNTGVTSFTDQTTLAGTGYTYLVYATSLGGNSPDSVVATVTTPLIATAPIGLIATATSATNVNLSWTDAAIGIETGFVVERSLNGTNFTQVGTTKTGVTNFTDQTAVAGTAYTYLVYATSLGGNSPDSVVATVTTPLIPTAPTGLLATATSATNVNLSWTDTAIGIETGFVVERSRNGITFAQVGTTNSGITSLTDSTAIAGTAYTYVVYATSLGGNSPDSIVARVTTPLVATSPTGLLATAASATDVNLSWTDTAAGIETGFVVERSLDGITFTQVGTTNTGVISFKDQTASAGTAYTYVVYATSLGGNSPDSVVATVTTPLIATAPMGLTATATSPTNVNLSWTDTAVGVEMGFVVERSLNGTTFTQVGTTNTGITTFTDPTAVGGTAYTYLVYATGLGGNSPSSVIATVTTPQIATAPTGLVATAVSTTQVNLSWTDTAAGIETGFIIQRSLDGTTFTQVGTTAAGIKTFADTTVSGGTAYTYRVQATSAGGLSPYSNIAKASTPIPPSAPTHLAAVAVSGTVAVHLTWTNTASAATGFIIQRSVNGAAFVQIGTMARNVTTYTDSTTSGATSYTYRVETTSALGNSLFSAFATVKTPAVATAPASLVATTSTNHIALSWTDTSAGIETGFVIERSSGGKAFVKVGATAKGITTFTDSSASTGVAYTYEIYATSTGGNSPMSAPTIITIYPKATAPNGLKAVAASATQVNLSWTDTAAGIETGFVIQRSANNGITFTTIDTTLASVITYVDKMVVTGTTYEYRIYALSAGGNSSNSGIAKVTTPA